MAGRKKLMEVSSQIEYLSEERIIRTLHNHKADIVEWAYILHDKDIGEDGELIKPHWHIELRLKDTHTYKTVARWFGIPENYVSKCTSKLQTKYKFDDMLTYLLHETQYAKDKHIYAFSEIKTNIPDILDRIGKFAHNTQTIEKSGTKQTEKQLLNDIITRITQGSIKEYNLCNYVSDLFYTKYSKKIKDAFDYRRMILTGSIDRDLKVYYLYGESGLGKTTYAKLLAQERGEAVYISSSGNDILNHYKGEEVIILDDLRPEVMELSDLLKLLDNNTSSTVKSRYNNKVIEANTIFITSIFSLEDFYKKCRNNNDESFTELARRIYLTAEFTYDEIHINRFNRVWNIYEPIGVIANPVLDMFPQNEPTPEEDFKAIRDFTTKKALYLGDERLGGEDLIKDF